MADVPATRDKARTRRAILDAAERAFADSGSSTSLAEIAAAAGVSKSGLLHHFGSREELVRAIAADQLERFRQEVHDRVDLAENRPGKLLRGYVRAMCDPGSAVTSAFAAGGFALAVRGVPEIPEMFAADEERWRADLAADGIPLERVLVVRYGAEGVASALSTWMMDDDDLSRVRAELLRLAEPE